MDSSIKSNIDKIWLVLHSGGIANPLTAIEQITYLLFIKGLDDIELKKEQDESILGIKIQGIFDEEHQDCRWSIFKEYEANRMFKLMQEKIFPYIKTLGNNEKSSYAKYMEDAIFLLPTPIVLQQIVTLIDKINMDGKDTKGDLYEYLLSKLATSGTNGQFRTPRQIIKMMVELMQPTQKDIVVDPACGSAGFLVGVSEYLEKNKAEIFNIEENIQHYNNTMFYGFDMDRTMLRISAMNLMQHGIENPNIEYKDSLSEDNEDESKYTLVLANPPFKGSINSEITSKKLLEQTNSTKKTELLFLALFLRILKIGGRCACIVPNGVLDGISKAHKTIRKELVENHKLEAIISMPNGIFKPYAGVSTAILIFTKTNAGGTNKVWFYDMQADGFSLDDKRQPIKENDIPDIIERFNNRFSEEEQKRSRTDKSFFVEKEEIAENGYDLSINKYKEIVIEQKNYEASKVSLKRIREKEKEFLKCLNELEEML